MTAAGHDALPQLLARLRELTLVEADTLTASLSDDAARELLATHADDLDDAIGSARALVATLLASIAGADPLRFLDGPRAALAGEAAATAGDRAAERLRSRATAATALARLDDTLGGLVTRRMALARRLGE